MKSSNVGGMEAATGEARAAYDVNAEGGGPVQSDTAHGAERLAMHSLTRLLEIQRDLAVRQLGCEDLTDYLEMLVESAARLPGFDCCGIYLCDEESGEMRLIAHRGLSEKFIRLVTVYRADSPQARLVQSGKLVYAMRGELPPEVAATLADEGLQLLAMVPLRDRGCVVAALNVSSRRQTCLESASCIALETFAAQAEGTITHIRAREARKEAERRLQLAIEGAQLGSWAADFGTGRLVASDLARRLHGLTMDFPLTVESAMEPVHPDDRAMVAEKLKRSIGFGEPFSTEYRTWMPGREGRWIHSEARFFDDAGRKRLYGIIRDVTELKQSRAALIEDRDLMERRVSDRTRELQSVNAELREQTMRLELALDASQGGVSCWDVIGGTLEWDKPESFWAIARDITQRKQAGRILQEWNQDLERRVAARTHELNQSEARFRQLAQATFEGIAVSEAGILLDGNPQIAEMHCYELAEMIGRPIADFIAPESRALVTERIASGDCNIYECYGLRKDGSVFPTEVRASMRTWQGRQMRVTAVRDLTSIKQAAARMQAQQTELAHAQRLALISEVSAGIVHQIGQPLCAIGANIAYALAGSPSCGPSQCRNLEILKEIHSDIERMRKTVTHLRALANPDMPTRKRCDLNELIGSVLSLLKEEAEYRKVGLVFDPGQGLPHVLADSVQFSQVILNLIRNAFDACAGRAPGERMVRITSCPTGEGGVEMKVIDSGAGINPDILPLLFAPFVTTKPEGTGIGLRLSRTIVHAHGGRISGINNPDAPGATFSVILPAHLEKDYSKV